MGPYGFGMLPKFQDRSYVVVAILSHIHPNQFQNPEVKPPPIKSVKTQERQHQLRKETMLHKPRTMNTGNMCNFRTTHQDNLALKAAALFGSSNHKEHRNGLGSEW